MKPVDRRRTRRIATLSAGYAFGELGLLDRGDRPASIVADTDLSCLYVSYESLLNNGSALSNQISLKLMTNIARGLCQTLRRATVEIKTLRSYQRRHFLRMLPLKGPGDIRRRK